MPRFNNEWLIDRVLFDYVNGGTCSCCSLSSAIFLPGGTAELIKSVTDIESDQMNYEISSYNKPLIHPWPQDLRDHVWASRVKLRQKLKSNMKHYEEFWNSHNNNDFIIWLTSSSIDITVLKRIFQLSRTEIMNLLENQYNIHSAYKGVLDAIIEQVAHFHLTNYPIDASTTDTTEINFENILGFNRYSGFNIDFTNDDNTNNKIDYDTLQIWMERMKSLCGPKLLARGTKNNIDNDNKNMDDDNDNDEIDGPSSSIKKESSAASSAAAGSSGFQSDRRMIRLIIARYWADLLIQKYNAFTKTIITETITIAPTTTESEIKMNEGG